MDNFLGTDMMSYLDQLKQETQAHQKQEIQAQQRQEQQRKRFQIEVKPSLEQLQTYLRELSQHLNYLKPNHLVSYQIQGVGKLEGLIQQNYRIITHQERQALKSRNYTNSHQERPETASNFCLRCECIGQYPIRKIKKYLTKNI